MQHGPRVAASPAAVSPRWTVGEDPVLPVSASRACWRSPCRWPRSPARSSPATQDRDAPSRGTGVANSTLTRPDSPAEPGTSRFILAGPGRNPGRPGCRGRTPSGGSIDSRWRAPPRTGESARRGPRRRPLTRCPRRSGTRSSLHGLSAGLRPRRRARRRPPDAASPPLSLSWRRSRWLGCALSRTQIVRSPVRRRHLQNCRHSAAMAHTGRAWCVGCQRCGIAC